MVILEINKVDKDTRFSAISASPIPSISSRRILKTTYFKNNFFFWIQNLINSQLKQGKSRKRVVQYQNHIVINSNIVAVIVNFGLESSIFVLVEKNTV